MNGTITYNGITYTYNGSTHLPLAAVQAYIASNSMDNISDVINFFMPGLKGTPCGTLHPFIIEKSDFLSDPSHENRYVKLSVGIKNNTGYIVPCYVSNQFDNSSINPIVTPNLPIFVKYIQSQGFSVTGYASLGTSISTRVSSTSFINQYGIIDISHKLELQDLREELFKKNVLIKKLLKSVDGSGILADGMDYCSKLANILGNSEYILFSSKRPKMKFGKYNIYDLISAICDLLSKILNSGLDDNVKGFCKEILGSFINNRDRYDNNRLNKKEINRRIDEVENAIKDSGYKGIDIGIIKEAINRVKKIANNLVIEVDYWGEYIDKEKVIVIYLNSILNKPSGNEFFSYSDLFESYGSSKIVKKDIETTYAHETFHLIHFNQRSKVAEKGSDYGYKVVIEGLARYFELKYLEEYRGGSFSMEIQNLKDDYSVISDPYAGACYVNRGVNSFGEIILKSLKSIKDYPHLGLHCLLQGTEELEEIILDLDNNKKKCPFMN